MRLLILLFLIVTTCQLVFSANEQCEDNKTSSLKVLGSGPYSYEILNSGYQFKIDGLKERFEGFIDKEAIKRLFMYCSPITASCLNQKSDKVNSGTIEIFFKINREQHPKPQNISLKTDISFPEKVKKCLVEKWSSLEMPTPSTSASALFSIDFRSASK